MRLHFLVLFSLVGLYSNAQNESVNEQLRHIRGMPPERVKVEIDKVLKTDSAVYQYLISDDLIFGLGMIIVLANDAERIDQVYEWVLEDFKNQSIPYRRQVELTCFLQRFRCNQSLNEDCIYWCEQMFKLNPTFRGSEYFHASSSYAHINALLACGQLHKIDTTIQRIRNVFSRYASMNPKSEIHLNYALGKAYEIKGDLLLALACLEKAEEVFEKAKLPKTQDWAKLNNNQGTIYELMGAYALAIAHFEEALRTIRRGPSIARRIESGLLNNIGFMNARLGNYRLAIAYYKESLHTLKTTSLRPFVKESMIYRNLAAAYNQLGHFDLALSTIEKCKSKVMTEIPLDHRHLVGINIIKAHFLKNSENVMGALRQLDSIQILMDSHDMISKDWIAFYRLKGELLMLQGNYAMAAVSFDNCLDYIQKSEMTLNLAHIEGQFMLAHAQQKNIKRGEVIELFAKAHKELLAHFKREYGGLSPPEQRTALQAYSDLLSDFNDAAFSLNDKELLESAFNQNILMKGLVLSNQKKLKAGRKNSDWLNSIGREEPKLGSVLNKYDAFNASFRNDSASQYFTQSLKFDNWKELQQVMTAHQLIVDWVEIPVEDHRDSIRLAVHILSKDMEYPKSVLVKSMSKKMIQSVNKGQNLTTVFDWGKDLWGRIRPYIKRGVDIHLCYSASLQKLPMASMAEEAGISNLMYFHMSWQDFNAVERELNPSSLENALLLGGLNYSSNSTDTIDEETDGTDSELRGALNELGDVQWPELTYTLNEVNSIESILTGQGLNAKILSGINGTEENLLKSISTKPIGLLHIATHGFLLPSYQDTSSDFDLSPQDVLWTSVVNDPMKSSGVLLSGSQSYWNSSHTLFPDNDNLLTAREVQKLNLSGTNLVVLSACQSARDMSGSQHVTIGPDGIYGLASSLKIAGAKRLLLALWDVDDRASMEFMILFYEELMEYKSPTQAMKNTRALMRQKYSDPKNWAGWALIH